jgi:hypothetical protein
MFNGVLSEDYDNGSNGPVITVSFRKIMTTDRMARFISQPRSPIILLTSEGKPWTPDGFRASFAKARTKAGIVGVTFNDLRGTAVTRLALAGGTEAEIATITGHSLRDVRSILDSNYLHRDPALGRALG